MKIICKNENYEASGNKGIFPKAFVKDTVKTILNDDLLEVNFKMFYEVDNIEKESPYGFKLKFTSHNKPNSLSVGESSLEIEQFLLEGNEFNESKVIDYGYPSVKNVKKFFKAESIWSELELIEESPLIGFVKSWILNNVYIDSKKLAENFKF